MRLVGLALLLVAVAAAGFGLGRLAYEEPRWYADGDDSDDSDEAGA